LKDKKLTIPFTQNNQENFNILEDACRIGAAKVKEQISFLVSIFNNIIQNKNNDELFSTLNKDNLSEVKFSRAPPRGASLEVTPN